MRTASTSLASSIAPYPRPQIRKYNQLFALLLRLKRLTLALDDAWRDLQG